LLLRKIHHHRLPVHFILPLLSSPIHPILQFLAHLEKRQFFRFDLYQFAGFWVPPGISTIFFHEKGTQTPDFNSIPLCQRIGHFVKKRLRSFQPRIWAGGLNLSTPLGFLSLDDFHYQFDRKQSLFIFLYSPCNYFL